MKPTSQNAASEPRISRQSLRSEATRKALLAAARKVFARDGFEAARIEDIAAEAGRSRGAFYANFANKESAFFALREQAIAEYKAEMQRLQQSELPPEKQREVFQEWLAARIPEASQILLQLEFKLYALRHPETRRQLLEQHLSRFTKPELSCTTGAHPAATPEEQKRMLLIEAVMEGLALNHRFSPELLTRDALRDAVRTLFSAFLPPVEQR
ncbi:MAG: TetR/AcrR family transcriptional regulator [Acidobacteria bacterium]|jgi:AcrR family transcriptional regulator|nr:TetR/AcrR family transcriptional regulator [Acidobacteriota bacterium]